MIFIEKIVKLFCKLANDELNSIQNLLLKCKDTLLQNGIDILSLKEIGGGDMGIAYLMPDGNILKATVDKNELYAAERLSGKNFKHLINILNVINFTYSKNWDSWNDGPFGVIVQEKIIPISGKEQQEFENAVSMVTDSLLESKEDFTYPFHKSWSKIEKMPIIPGQEKKFQIGMSILKNKFHLDEIINELRSQGIRVDDFNSGNFGKKQNGDYVLFDIGGPNMKFH